MVQREDSETGSGRRGDDDRDADVTALRRRVGDLEAWLRLAQERLEQITDHSLDIICQFAPDGVFTLVSRASSQVLGYPPEEIVGRHFSDFFAPESVAPAAAIFGRAVEGERIDLLSVTARHKDGRPVPLEVCAVALFRDGRVIGVQGIARDISRRRDLVEGLRLYSERLERLIAEHDDVLRVTRERLSLRLGRSQANRRVVQEREALLRAAFEQSGVGLALAAPDGTFLRVNALFAAALGADREQLLARRWQDVTHPDDLGEMSARWRRLCDGGEAVLGCRGRWCRADGSTVPVEVLVSAIRTAAGRAPTHLMMALGEPDRRPGWEPEAG